MKRKLVLLTAIILTVSLALTACGQKDIGEAKAKEIGLAYINNVFDTNQTEATVQRYVEECLPEDDGALVTGDPSIGTRVVYYVRVAKSETQPLYEAGVVGSSGNPYYAIQGEINLVLTDEQKAKANTLFAEEKTWGEKHDAALTELKEAGIQWMREKIKSNASVLLAASTGDYPHENMNITTTFVDSFYVVFRDGTIYRIRMQWPSMQILGISVEHES
ncbi:MAG: hypothetical protein GX417_09185 [Clostridiales bacterium]|nr:hypothetical protein [Clostridiales bacterium]